MSLDELAAAKAEIQRLSAELAHRTQVWEGEEWKLRGELSDARQENERLHVQLAGCGVAAMGDTREALAQAAKQGDYGWSASYGDVLRAVTRLVELREEVEDLKYDLEKDGKDYERAAKFIEAMGLVSTIHPTMQIDVLDPMGMARQIVDYVERLRKGREDVSKVSQAETGDALSTTVCPAVAGIQSLRNKALVLAGNHSGIDPLNPRLGRGGGVIEHVECLICGRTRETPWPEGPHFIYGWRTEHECEPCARRKHLDRQYRYEDAMQTLFGKFTPEQMDALLVVMGKK